MEENKYTTHLSYLDDNDKPRTSFVKILSIDDKFVFFETDQNRVRIPLSRVLKIKESKPCSDSEVQR